MPPNNPNITDVMRGLASSANNSARGTGGANRGVLSTPNLLAQAGNAMPNVQASAQAGLSFHSLSQLNSTQIVNGINAINNIPAVIKNLFIDNNNRIKTSGQFPITNNNAIDSIIQNIYAAINSTSALWEVTSGLLNQNRSLTADVRNGELVMVSRTRSVQTQTSSAPGGVSAQPRGSLVTVSQPQIQVTPALNLPPVNSHQRTIGETFVPIIVPAAQQDTIPASNIQVIEYSYADGPGRSLRRLEVPFPNVGRVNLAQPNQYGSGLIVVGNREANGVLLSPEIIINTFLHELGVHAGRFSRALPANHHSGRFTDADNVSHLSVDELSRVIDTWF